MRIFKIREFSKWAAQEGVVDNVLRQVVAEMECGLVGANLGGQVFKKRVALGGRGKRTGVRTLLAYRMGSKAFFIYGFAKNVKDNVSPRELKALKAHSELYLNYNDGQLNQAIDSGVLIEVTGDE
ncbi:MAG: type II toxin-antitoxin system RelE/ParE family toxin [Gammaproteobacteria bacterium]|nr:type II toxin-antitoxin system RelE/ParE family toxin [Gammaproteobacteria bacterium]MDE0513018.1 type II toxin-antitoxin system RelE/ParE family toxin [Gammaproteobacteria bacterium]